MKTLKLLMLASVITGVFASCSEPEDDSEVIVGNTTELVGTYNLVAWNAPVEVDLDRDGNANFNIMHETQCFDNSVMTINHDGSFVMTLNYVDVNNNFSCESEITHGTWSRSGNALTTTYFDGNKQIVTDYSFSKQERNAAKLSGMMLNCKYPICTSTGHRVSATGNVQLIMVKQ